LGSIMSPHLKNWYKVKPGNNVLQFKGSLLWTVHSCNLCLDVFNSLYLWLESWICLCLEQLLVGEEFLLPF
jgi:hypothetical protein